MPRRTLISLGVVYKVDRPYSTEKRTPAARRTCPCTWVDDYHVESANVCPSSSGCSRGAGDSAKARAYVYTGPLQDGLRAVRRARVDRQ